VAKRKADVAYRVFLSHSHKDRWIARQCARLIEEVAQPRVEVFFDEKDIKGGQSIPDSVRIAIEQFGQSQPDGNAGNLASLQGDRP
jgi:hypothetical protein